MSTVRIHFNLDKLFTLAFAFFVGAFLVMWTNLSMTWILVLSVLTLIVLSVPILIYSKKSLSFFFLCIYVTFLPIDMSKAFVFEIMGEEAVKYISLQDVILIPIVAFWFLELIANKKERIKLRFASEILIFFSLFLLWDSYTLVDTVKSHLGWLLILSYLKWMVGFISIANILNSKKRIQIVVILLMLSVFFESIYVILQTQFRLLMAFQGVKPTETGRYLYFGTSFKQLLRPAGTLHHPNVLATYLVYVLPLFFGLILMRMKWLMKIPLYFAFMAGTVALFLSFSRGGWLGFTCGILIILLSSFAGKIIKPKALISVFLIALLSAVVLMPYWQPIVWRLTRSDDKATHTRMLMMEQVMMMVKDKPLTGVGFGNYAQASSRYVPENAYEFLFMEQGNALVHNKYASILAETGIMGIAIYIWFLWVILKYAYQNLKIKDEYLKFLGLGMFGAFCGMIPNMFFDHHGDDMRNTLFWFFVAIIMALRMHFVEQKGLKIPRKVSH